MKRRFDKSDKGILSVNEHIKYRGELNKLHMKPASAPILLPEDNNYLVDEI